MSTIEELSEKLLKLADKEIEPEDPNYGLCREVFRREDIQFKDVVRQWPHFSGNLVYPIPCPDGGDPGDAYNDTEDSDMWNPDHPYGALRLDLCRWLSDRIKENVAKGVSRGIKVSK